LQALQERGGAPKRRLPSPWYVALALVVLVAAGGVAYAVATKHSSSPACSKGTACPSGSTIPARDVATGKFSIASTSPASGATAVPSNTTVSVTFSAAVKRGGPMPSISPPVTGGWRLAKANELVFSPSEPFVPFEKYTLTIPGGSSGILSTDGGYLAGTKTATFTIAAGSTKRLQELLATLGYLPLSYSGHAPAPQDMALPQPGTLTWRWPGLPQQLTDQWYPGAPGAITKGAVMMFETENGLTVDGIPGPEVWTALLADVADHKVNTEPVTYVLVTKTPPTEHLTAWVNGTLAFHDITVNTGVKGATTHNGTYQVFEHVRESHMSGTDVTGTHYTIPTVPWVSYFNGGDAMHYYPRASYGFPQSNGCVEMQLATAASLWPNTPIGTLVTVQGPTYGGTSSKNTTPATTG